MITNIREERKAFMIAVFLFALSILAYMLYYFTSSFFGELNILTRILYFTSLASLAIAVFAFVFGIIMYGKVKRL